MDCIFCKIIKGEIPSYTIYEDEFIKCFLDINPSTNGDLLIVPKKHYENILDIEENLVIHIHKVSKKIYHILKERLNIDGLTLVQNNFYGQEIKHYHLHLTPRYKDDNLTQNFNKDLLNDISKTYEKLKEVNFT